MDIPKHRESTRPPMLDVRSWELLINAVPGSIPKGSTGWFIRDVVDGAEWYTLNCYEARASRDASGYLVAGRQTGIRILKRPEWDNTSMEWVYLTELLGSHVRGSLTRADFLDLDLVVRHIRALLRNA